MPSVEHRQSQHLNRAENSHQPTRHRERAMKRFRTSGAAQRFLAVFSVISPHFRPRRHRLTADDYRTEMTRRFAVWNEVTGTDCRSLTHTTDTQPTEPLHGPIPLSPSQVDSAPRSALDDNPRSWDVTHRLPSVDDAQCRREPRGRSSRASGYPAPGRRGKDDW
jgi:putative transposase